MNWGDHQMAALLGSLAGVISAVAYFPLIWQILHGRVQPERLAWLIWIAEYAVLTAAQYGQGARASLPLAVAGLIGISVVYALSFKYGTGSVRRLKDGLVLAGVAAALAGWCLTRNPAIAVLLTLAVETTAAAINAVKAYRMPGTESYLYWSMILAAGLLDLPAARNDGSGILYAYPGCLIATAAAIIVAALLGASAAAGRHSRPRHHKWARPGSADGPAGDAGRAAVLATPASTGRPERKELS